MHLLALALAAQMTASGGEDFLLQIGDRAPPFSMRDLDREMFSLANHIGPEASEPRKAIVLVSG